MREKFEDTAELQTVIANALWTPSPQLAWEHGMERCVAALEKMLLRPAPTVLRPEPVSAAFGSAAQMATAYDSGHVPAAVH